ncbi:MAG: hypothetical protein ACKVS9_09560 [Phycisphaerae bacterium]
MRSIRFAGVLAGALMLSSVAATTAFAQATPPAAPTAAPAASQPGSAPTTKPEKLLRRMKEGETIDIPEPVKAPVSGPMRAEILAILDNRIRVIGEVPGGAPKPVFRVVFKVTGERLYEVFRVGKLIVEDMTDDAGTKLLDPTVFTDADRTDLQPLANAQAVTSQGYIMLDANPSGLPGRAAKTMKVRGFVNVAMGADEQNLNIDGVGRKPGEMITHAKLTELGVKARVLKLADEVSEPADGKGIAIRYEAGEDAIKNVEFYDDWMKKIATRPRPGTAKDGKPYIYYSIGNSGPINDDWQLSLTVFGKVEKMKLEVDAKDVELP